ncbi:MAG: DNA repair protein RecN [Lachnospiraceae bacterium]|nr:DNA repair protein RecN [Lachnospiraceae bacterium]
MLVNVNVKNLALINKVDIFFDEGLNILSGETGAGKSIIIGSILIALGGKIPKDIVRDSEKEALVELVFDVQNEDILKKIEEEGIDVSDGNIIISRKIVNARSTIKINGENITSTKLKKITELLIDIHGQHDHQSLLKKDKQLEILDDFAEKNLFDLKEKLKSEYNTYTLLKKELDEYNIDEDKRLREISFCKFEIEEIDNANLKTGEYDELKSIYQKMASSKSILEKMSEVYDLIAGDGYNSVSDKIGEAYRISQNASNFDEEINGITDSLADLESICEDTKRAIKDYIDSISFDDEECRQNELRLDELNRLINKYDVNKKNEDPVLNVLEYRNEQEEKLNKLENYEMKRKEILSDLEISEAKLSELSNKLTDIRRKSSVELSKNIVKVLEGLNFIDVKFDILFKEKENYTSNGVDEIEFMISTNPGEDVKPLNNVASGGELSRIMLGIKTILAKKDDIDTLIFDEIDTGISGRTAQMVAERLKEISKLHQVICITHLPQITSMANNHYLIEKSVVSGTTETNIIKLDYEQSVEELARMLGGVEITDAVIENAREMKKLANN